METMKEIRPGDDVSRKIRAFWFPPYDGAYQLIGNQKFTLVNQLILQQLADPSASNLFTETKC
jgi:methionyl-tRNA formyltransferase